MDGLSSRAPHAVGPRVQLSGACEQSRWWPTSTYSRTPSVISGSSSDKYWASLNPALANRHRLKRTPLNLLCLPEILSHSMHLVDLHTLTSRWGPELNSEPPGPVGETGHAHCSADSAPWGQAFLKYLLLLLFWSRKEWCKRVGLWTSDTDIFSVAVRRRRTYLSG